jgi:outer membrane biosynthesis protein TonB
VRCLFITVFFLFAATVTGAEEDMPWPEERPEKPREYIEVDGRVYPFFIFEQEIKPKPRPDVSLPKKAKREGRGGMVLFGVIVNKRGKIESANIAISNTEADVEDACRKTLYRYGFPVKEIDGEPVDYAVMVPIRADATPFFGPK